MYEYVLYKTIQQDHRGKIFVIDRSLHKDELQKFFFSPSGRKIVWNTYFIAEDKKNQFLQTGCWKKNFQRYVSFLMMSRLSSTCPVLVVLFRLSCLAILFRPGCHVLADSVLAGSILADFVLADFVLSWLVLSWLSFRGCPYLAVPSWLFCPAIF
jgi:hypothetical protein